MDNVIHLKEIFNTPNVIESICNWNAARYEQEFNKSLALKLLNEEFQETLDAPNVIEILDGLGDTFYVAVGVLWKYGGSPELITELFDHIETSMPIPSLNVSIQWVNEECTKFTVALTALSAFKELKQQLNNSDQAALDIIRAICDSNDSKVVVKTASDTKANIDKGKNFINPTDKISKVLELVKKGGYLDGQATN